MSIAFNRVIERLYTSGQKDRGPIWSPPRSLKTRPNIVPVATMDNVMQ